MLNFTPSRKPSAKDKAFFRNLSTVLNGLSGYDLFVMTIITILPEKADNYRALAGDKESTGRTAGKAVEVLTPQHRIFLCANCVPTHQISSFSPKLNQTNKAGSATKTVYYKHNQIQQSSFCKTLNLAI
ncbi:MAG: hypothetical protein ACR2LC_01460 [Pyrinomonadaceae bacterium]